MEENERTKKEKTDEQKKNNPQKPENIISGTEAVRSEARDSAGFSVRTNRISESTDFKQIHSQRSDPAMLTSVHQPHLIDFNLTPRIAYQNYWSKPTKRSKSTLKWILFVVSAVIVMVIILIRLLF